MKTPKSVSKRALVLAEEIIALSKEQPILAVLFVARFNQAVDKDIDIAMETITPWIHKYCFPNNEE